MDGIEPIVLASNSPRRARLLEQMGFSFRVLPAEGVDEDVSISDPVSLVLELSRRKAESVLPRVKEGFVVGADTVVCLEGAILGKPRDAKDAVSMLRRLSGKTHDVFTGFTVIQVNGVRFSDVERTKVSFRELEDWEITSYVRTGSPLDKAGAYGIQDRSGLFVDRIEGCFYNVVGFPLTKFYEGLKKAGGAAILDGLFRERRERE
jgi:septum formation protein